MSEMQKRQATYDPKTKTLIIDASKIEFVPKYLEYYLQYLGLPKDTKIVFLRDIQEV